MITVSISEAKRQFSELVSAVLSGKKVVITKRGVPVVELVVFEN
jgi:prevent-host-death family protein